MSLEDLLKPARWADELVLRQYTKAGRKLKLDGEKRKYWVGFGLNTTFSYLTGPSARALFGPIFDQFSWFVIGLMDGVYNFRGIFGFVKEENVSDTQAVDPLNHFYRKYNSIIRLPVLAAGVGIVGKYGLDLFNNVVNGVPMDSDSHYYLEYGLGLLSLASSMYLKEMDPKLLQKQPSKVKAFFIGLYEKAKGLVPSPDPAPEPVTIGGAFLGLENYALAPQPLPQPVALQSLAGLEDYLQA